MEVLPFPNVQLGGFPILLSVIVTDISGPQTTDGETVKSATGAI